MSSVQRSPLSVLLITTVLLGTVACRKAPQPALDQPRGPQTLFPVEVDDDWGYVTRTGEMALSPQFDRAFRFVNGRALIRQGDRYGFVDTSGTIVIPPSFARAWHFSEERAPVRRDSLWGFIDRSGTMAVPPTFTQIAGIPKEGRPPPLDETAPVAEAPSLLVPPPHRPPPYFSQRRTRIRTDDGWGYADRQGRFRIAPQFEQAWAFRDGLARVQFDGAEMGYVAHDGRVVWPPSRR